MTTGENKLKTSTILSTAFFSHLAQNVQSSGKYESSAFPTARKAGEIK